MPTGVVGFPRSVGTNHPLARNHTAIERPSLALVDPSGTFRAVALSVESEVIPDRIDRVSVVLTNEARD